VELSKKKGYCYIGSNSTGNNAFFVREDLMNQTLIRVSSDKFLQSNVRESRGKNGKLNYLKRSDQLRCIKDMTLVDIKHNKTDSISNLLPF
jgi:hypothetical protein